MHGESLAELTMNPKSVRWGDNFYGIFRVKFIFVRTRTKFITAEVCSGSCDAKKDFAVAPFTKYNRNCKPVWAWIGCAKVCCLETADRKLYQAEQMGTPLEAQVIHYLVESQIRKWMDFLQYGLTRKYILLLDLISGIC